MSIFEDIKVSDKMQMIIREHEPKNILSSLIHGTFSVCKRFDSIHKTYQVWFSKWHDLKRHLFCVACSDGRHSLFQLHALGAGRCIQIAATREWSNPQHTTSVVQSE